MVDSSGLRRRISRRTVSPPTPESKTPIGRESVTDAATRSARGGERRSASRSGRRRGNAEEGTRHLDRVAAHVRAGLRDHVWRALVAGGPDDLALGTDPVFGLATERGAQVGRVDARS